jgi:ABC-type sugar transport system ATPase subunit
VSIIGPMGAGKTTFFNVVAGLIDPSLETSVSSASTSSCGPDGRGSSRSCGLPRDRRGDRRRPPRRAVPRRRGSRAHALAVIGLLISTLLLAIIRPPWYSRLLSRHGDLSQRPTERRRRRRHRSHLPEHQAVPEHDGTRERAGRHAPAARSNLIDHVSRRGVRVARRSAATTRALELLRLSDCAGATKYLAKNLPYGDQRRLELARALANEPVLLLLG